MAPNQREPNKVMLHVWIKREQLHSFKKCAEASDSSMSAMIQEFISEKIREYETKEFRKKFEQTKQAFIHQDEQTPQALREWQSSKKDSRITLASVSPHLERTHPRG